MKVKSESEIAQSFLTLSNPMDCCPPGSSVHGIFQARVLEWGASAFSNNIVLDFAICQHELATDIHVPRPHPEPRSHLPLHPGPRGCPWLSLGALLHASNLHWTSILHMVVYMSMLFSQITPPLSSPTESKSLSLHLCLLCCSTCKIVVTIFLNSIDMH